MRSLLVWLHNWLGDRLDCNRHDQCGCFIAGEEEARDTVSEWFAPPERD